MKADTVIIIVNWNGKEHLEVCLNSVFEQIYKDFWVIFVDNNSTDDSVKYVKNNFPQIDVIECKKNYGFAEGNNIAIRKAMLNENIKYFVTLNNDTEVERKWLSELIHTAEKDLKIGAVASKMLFFNQRNIIDSTGDFLYPANFKVMTRGYKEEDVGQYESEEECFSARAGAALYRREMLEDIRINNDYFDSHYFAYIEDVDLSVRARLRDWKIFYSPKAIVYHKVSATGKRISITKKEYWIGRNKLFTGIKNYPVSIWPRLTKISPSPKADYQLTLKEKLIICTKVLFAVMLSLYRVLAQRLIIKRGQRISNKEILQWGTRFQINITD